MIEKFRRAIAFVLGGLVAILTFGLVQVTMHGKTSGADDNDARNPSTLGQPLDRKPERRAPGDEPPARKAPTPRGERKG